MDDKKPGEKKTVQINMMAIPGTGKVMLRFSPAVTEIAMPVVEAVNMANKLKELAATASQPAVIPKPDPYEGKEATCMFCGCTDSKACPGGCKWHRVDREKGEGVCSNCAKPAEDAKTEHCQCDACKDGILHHSDCAVHNMPESPNGPCDCATGRSEEKSNENPGN